MKKFKTNDVVYIKSDYEKNILKKYKIYCLNNEYAIIINKENSQIYKKIPLKKLTKDRDFVVASEVIKKGDLVKCVVDSALVLEGVVIESYNTFVLVIIGTKKKKISKNRVIVINN